MTKTTEIKKFCDELAKRFKPSKIILFGSYAQGNPRMDSDVDLLIAMPGNMGGAIMADRMIEQLKPRFAVDLIVKSEKEINRRLKQQDFFLQQAIREGQVLYETPHA
jgi:predicted nucleotidyltransferase